MMKKILISTLITPFLLAAAPPVDHRESQRMQNPIPFGGGMEDTRDFVVGAFLKKTPTHIMKAFGKKFNRMEQNEVGMDAWGTTFTDHEEIIFQTIWLKDKKWLIRNPKHPRLPPRPVIYFRAYFSRPISPRDENGHGTSAAEFRCWDAYYLLGSNMKMPPQCICPAPIGDRCPVHKIDYRALGPK